MPGPNVPSSLSGGQSSAANVDGRVGGAEPAEEVRVLVS
jgi:hypothetical protein